MKPRPVAGTQLSFQAKLESWAEGMDYCAVPVPAEVTAALGTKGPVLVKAQVNESAQFQVSLFPVGGGQHYIRIKSKVRSRVEHVFAVVKRLWGFSKVRYRGLRKNATRAFVALGLANIYLARGRLQA